MTELSVEQMRRELAAQRVLLDFFVSAAPFLSTHYYPPGKIVGAKLAKTIVDGVVVSEREVGGTVAPRSFTTDLAEAVAESEKIRKGETNAS